MRRRANNEGSIYQRTRDGKWVSRVELPSGKYKESISATKTAAQAKLKELTKLLEAGVEVLDSRQTLEQFLLHWLENTAKQTLKASSHESYVSNIKNRVLPSIGQVPLVKLNGQHLQKLYGELLKKPLAPSSVVRTHAVLHSALEEAVRFKLIARNPADDVKRPRIARREMQTLSREQVEALVEAATDGRFRALYALAATGGLRRGELLGLRWSDLDLDGEEPSLSIVRTAKRIIGKGVVFSEPKTARGRRKVRLSALAVRELRRHRTEQKAARLKVGPLWQNQGLVFASTLGTPMEESRLNRTFNADLYKASVPRVRFHDLRHTAATLLLSQNVHAKVVQEMLGHANIGVTLDLYSHVTPDMQAGAVAAMDAIFG